MQNLYGLDRIGLTNPKAVYRNMSPAWLTEQAIIRGEGVLSDTGALVVRTGKYTGRAPDDKFIVDTPLIHDYIAWNNINRPIEKAKFDALKGKMLAYLQNRPIYLFDGFAGADTLCRKKFRVVNELASECLFIRNLLIRPTAEELDKYGEPDFTIIVTPGFRCDPKIDGTHSQAAILVDYESHTVL
ncbi:MAG: phosphoenolpyruvate carboxykinase (ATP), partial [Megasphaera sp.]